MFFAGLMVATGLPYISSNSLYHTSCPNFLRRHLPTGGPRVRSGGLEKTHHHTNHIILGILGQPPEDGNSHQNSLAPLFGDGSQVLAIDLEQGRNLGDDKDNKGHRDSNDV